MSVFNRKIFIAKSTRKVYILAQRPDEVEEIGEYDFFVGYQFKEPVEWRSDNVMTWKGVTYKSVDDFPEIDEVEDLMDTNFYIAPHDIMFMADIDVK